MIHKRSVESGYFNNFHVNEQCMRPVKIENYCCMFKQITLDVKFHVLAVS